MGKGDQMTSSAKRHVKRILCFMKRTWVEMFTTLDYKMYSLSINEGFIVSVIALNILNEILNNLRIK